MVPKPEKTKKSKDAILKAASSRSKAKKVYYSCPFYAIFVSKRNGRKER